MMRGRSKWFWAANAAAVGGGALLLGLSVAASGVIPIKASSGHWALTEWILHFSMRRSIVTHTLGDHLPDLADPALVLKGAGHYEGGCKPCHGSPELHEPRVARAMLPPPPDLKHAAQRWQPEELFYIVRHGIKFTGMPAWPTPRRDDEILAVVAFLEALPELDAARYRALVDGPAAQPASAPALSDLSGESGSASAEHSSDRGAEGPHSATGKHANARTSPAAAALSERCARCHGRAGEGRENAAFPRLAGQRAGYLLAALDAYADDRRHSGIMQPIAATLQPRARRELAAYYAAQARVSAAQAARDAEPAEYAEQIARGREIAKRDSEPAQHAEQIARGREIALHGIADQRVPACASCHGPNPERRNPGYPRLAGQFADYLVLQLDLFQRAERGGSANQHLMLKAAPPLHAEQMRDVAEYYAALSDDNADDTLSTR